MMRIEKSVGLFKALGDITRLKIVDNLLNDEKSVNNIANELQMTQSAISHQLKILKIQNVVKSERRGKEVYYSLSDQHVKVMVEEVFNHISHILI